MSLQTKMWVQIAGALFFVVITIGEASGIMKPTFGLPMGWIMFALASATMVFEAWRTWRKMNAETDNS